MPVPPPVIKTFLSRTSKSLSTESEGEREEVDRLGASMAMAAELRSKIVIVDS